MGFKDSGYDIGYLCKNTTHYMNLEKTFYCQENQSFFFPSLNKSIGIGTKSFLTINLCLSKLWRVFMSMYFLVAWEVKSIGYLCKNTTHYMNLVKKFIAKTISLFFFFSPSLNKSIGIGTNSFLTINFVCLSCEECLCPCIFGGLRS